MMQTEFTPHQFIEESNRIEGIIRQPLEKERLAYHRIMALNYIDIEELVEFVKVYQPNAVLRNKKGLNVRVGNHIPPRGGKGIEKELELILANAEHGPESAYETHLAYEELHPFTDCNGRSGRMLWLWQMGKAPLGFLHTWYYQTLSFSR